MLSRPAARNEHLARLAYTIVVSGGSPTPPSGNEIVNAIHFDVTTSSPWVLLPIPGGAVFNRAAVLIETPFDDVSATLRLGTSLDTSQFLRSTDSTLSGVGSYDSGELHILSSDVLILTLDAGSSTVGEGFVFYRILTP